MKIKVGVIGHIEGPRLSEAIANLLKDEKGFQFNFLEMPYNKNSVAKFIEEKDLIFICNPGESDINKYVRTYCQKQKIDFFIPNQIDNRRMPTLEAKYGLRHVFQLILGYNNSNYINSKLVKDLTAEKMLKLWKDAYIERPYNFPKKDKDLWNWFESDDCPYPWLRLDLKVPHEQMYMEAINVKNKSLMHRSDEAGGTWNATTLFGLASDITSGYDYIGVDKTKYPTKPKPDWTELADECPITKRFFMHEFPLKNYVVASFGFMKSRPALILELTDTNDNIGLGEIWCNFPSDGASYKFKLFKNIFVNKLIHSNIKHPKDLRLIFESIKTIFVQSDDLGSYNSILSAIDCAYWDLIACLLYTSPSPRD